MSSVDKATETQLKNIQARSGKSLEELFAMIKNSGLSKHGEMREMVQRECGLGYGDASTLVLTYQKAMEKQGSEAAGTSPLDVLDDIYSGAKASLRPIHEKLKYRLDRRVPGFLDHLFPQSHRYPESGTSPCSIPTISGVAQIAAPVVSTTISHFSI